jgi:hypothetical protein
MLTAIRALFGRAESAEVRAGRARMVVDHRDPDRRFAFGLLAVSYSVDPAYLPVHATMAVRDWYNLASTVGVRERILQYALLRGRNPGYDLFRAAFLARAGLGAGLLGEDESWHRALQVATEVRATFSSWQRYALSYEAGHLEHRRALGDDRAAIDEHRDEIRARVGRLVRTLWRDTPFPNQLS